MSTKTGLLLRNSGPMGPKYTTVSFSDNREHVEYDDRGNLLLPNDFTRGLTLTWSNGATCVLARSQVESLRDFLDAFLDSYPAPPSPGIAMIERY